MAKAIQIDGKKFARLRSRKLMTQEEVARQLEMTTGRVVGIEGKTKIGMYAKNFRKLAELWGLSTDELLLAIGAPLEKTVSVDLPTNVYDQIKFFADKAGIDVPQMIASKFRPYKETLRTHSPQGEASSPPPEPPPARHGQEPAGAVQRSRRGSSK